MLLEMLAIPAVIFVAITGFLLLVSTNWRLSIFILAGQYAGVFVLVAPSWSVEMAVVKPVAGWMAGAVLGLALLSLPQEREIFQKIDLTGILFRLLLSILVVLVTVSLAPQLARWVPGIVLTQAYGGSFLISMGLVHLGLTARSLRVILGLLTVFSGFEVFYAAVENSILVSGLLAGVNLGLALVGAYLTSIPAVDAAE